MTLPKFLTTVSAFSRYLSMLVVIIIPMISFMLGIRYQSTLDQAIRIQEEESLLIERIPTPVDETANWKTFVNTYGKYAVKHPETLSVYSEGIDQYPDPSKSDNIVISDVPWNYNYPAWRIMVLDKSKSVFRDEPLKTVVETNYESNKAKAKRIIEQLTDTAFLGEKAYTYIIESDGYRGKWQGISMYPSKIKIIEFEHSGMYFTIFYNVNTTFDQILSTFQFTQ